MVLQEYTYVFAIGTIFALLEAYNNGANDVANSWATSVSSRSISYRMAMVCALVFELLGALTVGARTASTIKDGIISASSFQGNPGVQLLAFACAACGAATWVMWCSRNNVTVSSTYALVSSLIGVGIATGGTKGVKWSWNNGKGVGAIFAGLLMAPAISACFGAIIFTLIKVTVHMRKDPVPWAVWTSPFFFLIAGTVCTLSVVYKGSPRLGLSSKPAWYIASVTVGVGVGLCILSAIFFLPFVHAKVVKKDHTLKWWEIVKGPLLWSRPAPEGASEAKVPNFAVIQNDESEVEKTSAPTSKGVRQDVNDVDAEASSEKAAIQREINQEDYAVLMRQALEKHHAKLRTKKNPLGWAMRYLHAHPMGAGSIHEIGNLVNFVKRIPAIIVVALLYGTHYDIHTAQVGVEGTPEGKRMERTYAYAPKYSNEVEYLYSFVQVITACTASFAHGANDVGNAVGIWAGMYAAWSTGRLAAATEDVPLWQIAVMVLTLILGFVTYGYNIMKVMGNKITYHSPSRGSSMEMGAAITVLVFSQYKLPVSTTMCITGATVGVGLCSHWRAVNWKRVLLVVFSWFMTIPIAGLIGGCTMALALNAPHFA
ncbi:phosphate transporter [Plectosphaerella cucumerina]|uniref:Phosphate transporter n=1 Tax=Plectosphaerella cucumerina TaxID=40658 RepID=A0A8K0THG4_9PEZI|nr:phosphate transporter [Plectosphaerella cucumerina]